MSDRVLLIGLDGATFTVLDSLATRGVMPFLARFMGQGVRAGLRTIVPALTPPAWTSLMTGRTPGHHGVFDFFRMDSAETRHIRFATSRDVACDTIWDIASRHERRVTALNFPLMFPPPRVAGSVVPGWVPWRQLRLACHPADLFDRLKALPGFEPRELAMDVKLEERATEGCSAADEYAPWIELHIRREQNWLRVMRHLIATDPSDLTAVVFDGVDKLQHLCWRFIDCDPRTEWATDWERRAHQLCMEYFSRLDAIISELCALAGEDATVILASDHGFGPTEQVFHLNTWLEQHGYLAWAPDAKERQGAPGALLGVNHVARHTFLMDWSRTRAFATTPTSNGIFVAAPNGEGGGVADAEYQLFRERLIEQLRQFCDPATGEPIVSRIWTREEAFSGPFMGMAPDLTLGLRDGGLISILPSEATLTPRPHVSGTHRPVGIFIARGPGMHRNARVDEMSILDVAPTVLHSLGLPVPEEMEGRVPDEIYEPAALRARPVRVGAAPAAEPDALAEFAPALDPEQEAIVMARLQELGYIE